MFDALRVTLQSILSRSDELEHIAEAIVGSCLPPVLDHTLTQKLSLAGYEKAAAVLTTALTLLARLYKPDRV